MKIIKAQILTGQSRKVSMIEKKSSLSGTDGPRSGTVSVEGGRGGFVIGGRPNDTSVDITSQHQQHHHIPKFGMRKFPKEYTKFVNVPESVTSLFVGGVSSKYTDIRL